MKLRRALIAPALLASALLLGGCVSGGPDQAAHRQPNATRDNAWIERRASQLKASGLNDSQASAQAQSDFASQFGYTPETYTLYDSKAKSKAEEQELKDDLRKSQRDG